MQPVASTSKLQVEDASAGNWLQQDRPTLPNNKTELTFRHVLSDAALASPLNPLRAICLIDIDAAYAQFEIARLGLDPSLPVAVQQWQGLIAINYPARKFGISRHETADEAKKKCPDLICVHVATYKEGEQQAGYYEGAKPETHKVSLEHYRRESVKILKIFSDFCPTIEKASIDEAYMDFTVPVRDKMLERYPELRSPPDDSQLGLDAPLPPAPAVSFEGIGHLIPIIPIEKDFGKDAASQEVANETTNFFSLPTTEDVPSWEDVAISIAAELVSNCREAVRAQLGYTCSAGVARNKTLAKLCAGWNKPDAQTILRSAAIAGFLRPLSFQKIRFLGGKLGNAIAEQYEAQSVGDLWTVSLEEFQEKYGAEQGLWTWEIIRGLDRSEVAKKTLVKSMISSKNFRPSISTIEEALHWLKICAVELFARLNEAREAHPGVWPKSIVLHFRSDTYVSKARQDAFPYVSSFSSEYILKRAEKLLREFVAEKKGGGVSFPLCTNLALKFQGLERQEKGQKGIESFLGQPSIRDGSPKSVSAKRSRSPSLTHAEVKKQKKKLAFHCERCKESIEKDLDNTAELDPAIALDNFKTEHVDWHFARDLAQSEKIVIKPKQVNATRQTAGKSTSNLKSKTPVATPGTLQTFFGQKRAS